MENGLTIKEGNMLTLMVEKPLGELIKPLSNEILLFDSYVAGTSYIEDESILEEIKEGDKLTLKREPDNRFDDNAILVFDEKSRKLGYIPEKDNIVVARRMDAGKYLTAKVVDSVSKGFFKQIKISIYLVDF